MDSALNQTHTDLEVVICNDGSTDKTLEILENHYSDTPNVRWINQSNQGIAAASNTTVRACRGMYIGQLDADDKLFPDAVETMVKTLNEENYGMVYGREVRMSADGDIEAENSANDFSRERLLVSMICSPFRMFRKRDWSRIKGFDRDLKNAVDYDLALKLNEVCYIKHIPELTYYYRFHGENTSLVDYQLQIKNHIFAINKALVRMGLSDQWLAIKGTVDNPRHPEFVSLQ